MCEEMNCNLLGGIPLDPSLLKVCEAGQSILKENIESKTSQAFLHIVSQIKTLIS
jgi:septum formation inhibitor-activating ATPase MinD